jgi:predicted transcriptional regulator
VTFRPDALDLRRLRVGLTLLLLLAGSGPAVAGSYLARCPALDDPAAEATLTVEAKQPTNPGCTVTALPVDSSSVLAVVPAPRRPAGAPEPQTVALTGTQGKSGFEVREVAVTPISLSTPPPYLVPGVDFRAVAVMGVTGPLGRATLSNDDDQTLLDCTPGKEPAGLAFTTTRMPPIPGMMIDVVHVAEDTFRLVVSAPGSAVGQEPRLLSKLKPADSPTEAHIPLPADLAADTPLDFAVLCPAAGGHLALSAISLEAKTAVPTNRATWIRTDATWQETASQVFSRAQHWGLTRISIHVPTGDGGVTDPQALAGFVTAASAHGISVWALASDSGNGSADSGDIERAGAAFSDYNAAVPAEAQIKGLEVELRPGRIWSYVADPEAAALSFIDRLEHLRPSLGMPLSAVVPAWFPTGASVAERLAAVLDRLTVVTDRTDPIEIRRAVARFLAWGTRRNRRVDVALEAGPVAESERGSFVRAEAGELWLVPVAADDTALLLLKEPAQNLPGIGFRQDDVFPVPAESRSFLDRRSELRESLAPLGRTLGAWPSFGGFAFHGLFTDHE